MAGEKHWHKSAVSSKKGLHRKNKLVHVVASDIHQIGVKERQ